MNPTEHVEKTKSFEQIVETALELKRLLTELDKKNERLRNIEDSTEIRFPEKSPLADTLGPQTNPCVIIEASPEGSLLEIASFDETPDDQSPIIVVSTLADSNTPLGKVMVFINKIEIEESASDIWVSLAKEANGQLELKTTNGDNVAFPERSRTRNSQAILAAVDNLLTSALWTLRTDIATHERIASRYIRDIQKRTKSDIEAALNAIEIA